MRLAGGWKRPKHFSLLATQKVDIVADQCILCTAVHSMRQDPDREHTAMQFLDSKTFRAEVEQLFEAAVKRESDACIEHILFPLSTTDEFGSSDPLQLARSEIWTQFAKQFLYLVERLFDGRGTWDASDNARYQEMFGYAAANANEATWVLTQLWK